jgi:tape measure domain-containing protein
MADRELDLRLIIRADGSLAIRNLNQVDDALDRVGHSAHQAGGEVRNMGNQVNQSSGVLNTMRGTLREFAIGVASAFTIKAIFDFGAHILRVNREMEDLRATLKSVTGSSEAAMDVFDQIQTFARDTPFQVQELTETFIKLKSFGIEPTNQVMLAITNQASKLGASSETLSGITLALGQAWAKGKLQGEEILQLVERGVPVYDILAKVTGKNSAELQKMAEKGELGRAVIQQLIVKMGELANGANAEAINTISGSVSNLSDAWTKFEDNLLGADAENGIKRFTTAAAEGINRLADALELLDAKFNGASTPRFQQKLNLAEINDLYEQIEKQKRKISAIQGNGAIGSLIDDFAGNDVALEQNRLDAMYKELSGKIKDRSLLLDEARGKAARNSAEADKKLKAALSEPGDTGKGNNKALDDAKQQAAAETQIQLDKIARIEQIANAEFANDLARAKAQSAEKLAKIKGDKAAELAIEQELADAKAQIERNQLEASRSFAEERLRAQLVGKQQELSLTSDRGEQAKINAEIVKIEEQIKAARELSGLAAQKLGIDETAAAAQRAQAQQALVDQVILKYDILAARMKEFEADTAIISNSNLPLQRQAEIVALIKKRQDELGKSAEETGDTMSKFAEQGARNMQDAFADFLFDPFQDGLDGMLRGFIDMIRRMTAEALSAEILQGLLGKQNKGGNQNNGNQDNGEEGSFSGGLFSGVLNTLLGKSSSKKSEQSSQSGAIGSSSPDSTPSAAESSDLFGGFFSGLTEKFQSGFDSVLSGLSSAGSGIGDFFSGFGSLISDGFSSLVSGIGGGLSSAGSGISSFFSTVLSSIGSAFLADGGRTDATSGGRQHGPGTTTSDSIPAWLSTEEGVVKAASMEKLDKKYGPSFFDYLNENGDLPPSLKALAAFAGGGRVGAPVIPKLHFSGGGRVDSNANSRNSNSDRVVSAPSDKTPVNIFNITDKQMVHDAMASAAGQRIVLNAITNNPRAVRQALEI